MLHTRTRAAGLAIFILVALTSCGGVPGFGSSSSAQFEATDFRHGRWLKGNTHTHTLESDGDSPPDVVANWYKIHGYNFLVLSDHNVWVNPARLARMIDSSFLLIPGEEVTTAFQKKPVHVNGLNIDHVIQPQTDTTLLGTVQKNVDGIRAATGDRTTNRRRRMIRWPHGRRKRVE